MFYIFQERTAMKHHDSDDLIERLNLLPHPEGGYYRETYRSGLVFDAQEVSGQFPGKRCCSTGIYFLLRDKEFSAFHRIKADELWHFYSGTCVVVHVIGPEGNHHDIHLGSSLDRGQVFQALVPAGCWFAASVLNESGYALVGCTTAPGFEFEDFEMADRKALIAEYPALEGLIRTYTR